MKLPSDACPSFQTHWLPGFAKLPLTRVEHSTMLPVYKPGPVLLGADKNFAISI